MASLPFTYDRAKLIVEGGPGKLIVEGGPGKKRARETEPSDDPRLQAWGQEAAAWVHDPYSDPRLARDVGLSAGQDPAEANAWFPSSVLLEERGTLLPSLHRSKPPIGYVCHKCSAVEDHSVNECPLSNKPPLSYVCKRCSAVAEHFLNECPHPNRPPIGYTCKRCLAVENHFLNECPNPQLVKNKPPSGYMCKRCSVSEDHFLNECPLNTCFKC